MIAAAHNTLGSFHAPHIDWKAMSPLIAVLGGSVVVLLAGLLPGRRVHRVVVPALAIASLLAAIGLTIWIWEPGGTRPIVAGALSVDTLALGLSVLFYIAGIATILLSLRSAVVRETGPGEYASLLLGSIGGMVLLAGAQNLVTIFIGMGSPSRMVFCCMIVSFLTRARNRDAALGRATGHLRPGCSGGAKQFRELNLPRLHRDPTR